MNRTGTVKELIGRFNFGGSPLNAVEFGILANRLGARFATEVGKAPKPEGQRGKPATIWRLAASKSFPLSLEEITPVAASADADSAPASTEGESAPASTETAEASAE